MKQYDICALGELLIDFTENGVSPQGNPVMEANPGGAPCNVLAMASKLGCRTAFIGKVGDDIFGRQLRKAIRDVGIDDTGLVTDRDVNTTLAFVHTGADGEREFSFYRKPGADMMLSEEDVPEQLIENCKIFHFGSLSMTSERCEKATKKAIEIAKKSGAIVSFDPNLRENLWDSLDTAKEKIRYGLSKCDILKISDNEIQWLTGEEDFDAAVNALRQEFDIPLIFLTLGKDGSRAYSLSGCYAEEPVIEANSIEKTGAGDTFFGCALARVLACKKLDLSISELSEILKFANAGATIITTRKGALKVMPELSEIISLLGDCKS